LYLSRDDLRKHLPTGDFGALGYRETGYCSRRRNAVIWPERELMSAPNRSGHGADSFTELGLMGLDKAAAKFAGHPTTASAARFG